MSGELLKRKSKSLWSKAIFNVASSTTQTYKLTCPCLTDFEGKLIGRIRKDLEFEPWVRAQVPERNIDRFPCVFEYNGGHPFLTSHNVAQPA